MTIKATVARLKEFENALNFFGDTCYNPSTPFERAEAHEKVIAIVKPLIAHTESQDARIEALEAECAGLKGLVPRWIPCSERLPDIGDEVLVCAPSTVYPEKNPVKMLARLIEYEGAADFYWGNSYNHQVNFHLGKAVTHWMPKIATPATAPLMGDKEKP